MKVSSIPVASANVRAKIDISNVPKGPKLTKFFIALLKIYLIPLILNKFSTVISVGSNSFVYSFILLYVPCISNKEKMPLNTIIIIEDKTNIVIGWK